MLCRREHTWGPGASDGSPLHAAANDALRAATDAEDLTFRRGDANAAASPGAYAGRTNPISGEAEAVSAGGSFFAARCALCHGSEGRGDGPEGPADPPPADLTARRRTNAHLFWRISEGGRASPFCSAMPAFDYASERTRWQIVAFVQTLAPRDDAGTADAGAE